MLNVKKMNVKERKRFFEVLSKNYGLTKEDFKEFSKNIEFYYQEKKKRVYIAREEFSTLTENTLKELRIDSFGNYIGTLVNGLKGEQFRVSIEGSQLIGPYAKKNLYQINNSLFKLWIRGYPLRTNPELEGFIIISHKDEKSGKTDYCGGGKYVPNEGTIHNYIPKTRRVMSEE